MNNAVKSAARVLDLLELMAITPFSLGVSEIGRRLDMPKSSVSMLLATLEGRGYVVADAARQFRIHPMFSKQAGSWTGGIYGLLRRIARPEMAALAKRTGESNFLGVLTRDLQVQYIEKAISLSEVRFDPDTTLPRPPHCTSCGLMLLAYQSAETLKTVLSGPLAKRTTKTITDPRRLHTMLEAIRVQGYAASYEANLIGASGYSAPVFGPNGAVVAAICIAAPTARFQAVRASLKREIIAVARSLSDKLSDSGAGNLSEPPPRSSVRGKVAAASCTGRKRR